MLKDVKGFWEVSHQLVSVGLWSGYKRNIADDWPLLKSEQNSMHGGRILIFMKT